MDVKTRSISSSIVDFFRKNGHRHTGKYEGNEGVKRNSNESRDENGINDTSMGFQGSMFLMNGDIAPSNVQNSMILYESEADSQVRPPVLPILPVQRLRLLRQKQEWRRKLSSDLLRSLSGSQTVISDVSILNPSYSRASSSTPSPIKSTLKNGQVNGLKSLKKKKVSNVRSKGTKWTGEFDYDLSEYDDQHKEVKATEKEENEGSIDSPMLSIAKRSVLQDEYTKDVNTNTLSKAQRDVLLKGQPSCLVRKSDDIALPKASKTRQITLKLNKLDEPKGDKSILPSVGFDFIKTSDTPSKKSPIKPDRLPNQAAPKGATLTFSSQAETTSKQPFKFGSSESRKPVSESDGENEPRRKRAAPSDKSTFPELAPQPAFESGVGKDHPRPFVSNPTTGKSVSIPSFTFGKQQNDLTASEPKSKLPNVDSGSQEEKAGKPLFSFTAKSNSEKNPKPLYSFGAKPTEVPQIAPTSDNSGASSIVSAPKLSFDFTNGSSSSTKESGKSTFSLGKNTVPEKKDTPTAPSFSFSASASNDKNDTTAKPSFSFGAGAPSEKKDTSTTPAFSFGKMGTTDKKDTPAGPVSVPSFTFGGIAGSQGPETTSAVTPDVKAKDESDKQAAAPSFSFGAKASQTAPSFSFGAGEKKGSTAPPSFSFTKEIGASDDKKEAPKTAFSFGSINDSAAKPEIKSQPSSGFSFGRPQNGGTDKPSFTFSKPDVSQNKAPSFGQGASSTAVVPAASNGAFSFNKISGTGSQSTDTSYGSKFAPVDNPSAPAVQSSITAAPTNGNPFINSKPNTAFSLGSAAAGSGGFAQPAFQQPQPLQSAFGTTPSPAFGKSVSPPVINGSNNPSRTFTPSNTININFGNAGSVDPSAVFSGASGSTAPQQVFGATPPPSQIFGGTSQAPTAFNNAPMGFGTGGMAVGQSASVPQQQAPAPSFQLPPGRKLARMRQSRR